jgi:hypothetical protein
LVITSDIYTILKWLQDAGFRALSLILCLPKVSKENNEAEQLALSKLLDEAIYLAKNVLQ